MTLASLVPISETDVDGNVTGGSFTDIDNTIAIPSGVALVCNNNSWTSQIDNTQGGEILFGLTNAPGDFSSFTSIRVQIRAQVPAAGEGDTCTWRMEIEGTNAPTATLEWTDTEDGDGYVNKEFTDSGITPSAADIDGWVVHIYQWLYSQDMGPDGLEWQIDEIELILDYTTSAGGTINNRTLTDNAVVTDPLDFLRLRARETFAEFAVDDFNIELRHRVVLLLNSLISIIDTITVSKIKSNSLADIIELIDNHIELRDRFRSLFNSIVANDNHIESRHRDRELFDSIVAVDNVIAVIISATFRTLLSSIDTTDSSLPLRLRDRLAADEATVADVLNVSRARNRLSVNSLVATDSLLSLLNKPRTLVDTLDVVGDFIGLLKRNRILTDNPAITDAVIANYIKEGGILNTILLMDQFNVFDFITVLKIQELVNRDFKHDIEQFNIEHSINRLHILTKITRET